MLRIPEHPAPILLCAVEHGIEHVRIWQRGQVYFEVFVVHIAHGGAGLDGRASDTSADVEGPASESDVGATYTTFHCTFPGLYIDILPNTT